MLFNCGIGEDSWESLGLQDQTSPSYRKSVPNIHRKDWCWSWNSNTFATLWKELIHSKRSWCWTRFNAWEGDDRGWGGWMAALTLWTWVWVSSGSWWWTGKPGVLQSMGLQRVGHNWVTELNWQLSYWPVLPYLFNGRALYAVPLVIKNKKQPWSDITLIFARVNFPGSS